MRWLGLGFVAWRCHKDFAPDGTGIFVESQSSDSWVARFCFFRMHWGHEPDNGVGARLCEPQRVATAPSPAGHRPALRDGRFTEGSDAFSARIGTMNLICI